MLPEWCAAGRYDATMTTRMKIGVILPHAQGDASMPGDPPTTPAWPAIRAIARRSEELGLDSVWVFDHLIFRGSDEPDSGLHEAWTILAATAAVTERVELGALVMCTSFRNPALLAKMAATLDDVSGGRLILGIGCGWHDPEYEAFGYPTDHKVGRFEEALSVIRPMLRGETVTVDGRWIAARDARLVPPPARADIPVLIAAKGPRMLDLAARHADAWNTAWFAGPDNDRFQTRLTDLRRACEAAGRDPSTMELTVGMEARPADLPAPADENPAATFSGTADELADRLRAWEAVGIGHVVTVLSPMTPDVLEWFGDGVARYRSA
jgi:probable F420-dependent oxidoreductase